MAKTLSKKKNKLDLTPKLGSKRKVAEDLPLGTGMLRRTIELIMRRRKKRLKMLEQIEK